MGDTNDDQTDNQDSPSFLRTKWEEEQQKNKDLTARLAALEQDEQLRDAGLGHLNKRQRGVVLREMAQDNLDFSAENAMNMATSLGFPTTATPPPAHSSDKDNGDNGQSAETQESLDALSVMEQARRAAATNQGSPDLVQQMQGAKSKEELRSIIRDKGPRSGLIHEWDVP